MLGSLSADRNTLQGESEVYLLLEPGTVRLRYDSAQSPVCRAAGEWCIGLVFVSDADLVVFGAESDLGKRLGASGDVRLKGVPSFSANFPWGPVVRAHLERLFFLNSSAGRAKGASQA